MSDLVTQEDVVKALQMLDKFRRYNVQDRQSEKKVLTFIAWVEKTFGLDLED